MIASPLFSSRSEDWETPQALFALLDGIYGFKLDACASPSNAKCSTYFTKADDALKHAWAPFGRVWLNPPYGRNIGRFMEKAATEAEDGAVVVALVPARTDTRWWHAFVVGKARVHFLKGRLRYGHECVRSQSSPAPSSAPFPSALVVYDPPLAALWESCRTTCGDGQRCDRRRSGRDAA